MNAIIVALLLSQTMAEARGAILALREAGKDIENRTITYPAGANMACVGFAGGVKPAGTNTIRVGIALLSKQTQIALGATPLKDAEGNDREWVYGAMEIQSVAVPAGDGLPALPNWLRILETDEVTKRASPAFANCEIAIVREGFTPSIWRCGCSSGSNCNWTPPLQGGGFGPSVAAPKNLTLPAGTFTGTGCVPKVCVEWAEATSMPLACQ